jgi:hypothetical protein
MYDLITPLPESRPPSTAPSNGAGGSKSGRSGGSGNARSGTGTGASNALSTSNTASGSSARGDRNRLGGSSASPYPHSLKPRAQRVPGPNDPDYVDGYSSPLSLSMGGGHGHGAKTPVDPLMLGVSSGVPGAGGGVGSGRTPSPGRTASTGTDVRDDRSTTSANGAGAGGAAGAAGGSGAAGSSAISIMPARAWSSPQGREISNLAFDSEGEWVGCVAGSRLSVLKV